jgi:two-component system chemotaxis sensor kinase CheA
MDDLISEFLTETAESLETIDVELVRFESNPDDRAILDNIFRLLHTIKGTCGFLGLPRLEAVAHAGETLLGKFRDGAIAVTPPMVTLVLESIDQIKVILEELEASGCEPEGEDSALIKRLEDAAMGRSDDAAPAPQPEPEPEPEPEPVAEETSEDSVGFDADLGRDLRPGEVSLAELEAAFNDTPVEGEAPAEEAAAEAPPEKVNEDDGDWDAELGRNLRPGEVSMADLEAAFQAAEVDAGMAPAAPAPSAPTPPAAPDAPRAAAGDGDGGPRVQQTIRVGVDVLENLMTTVSELVLTRNQLLQLVRGLEDNELKGPLQRLSAVTGELQDGVMKTRMQPIGDAWRKLPRIVRDVSNELGKKIDLIQEGADTELDRQVLELIKDPLTHMVRNSADHGMEMPDDRINAGKSERGTIRLSAYHEGGHIIISIDDDGRGLNTAKIGEKAIEKGLATSEELAGMTEAQIHRFIFAAGFSTAAKVTNLSGRGVGMDVVRTNIEQIGGVVDVHSTTGKGSVFTIKIPLTLAIVSSLIVGCADERFAVPQLSVRELVRVGQGSEHTVEKINGARVMRLRDRLLPLVDLRDSLNLADKDEDHGFVVVIDAGGRNVGIAVDDVLDTEEIVVKPLSDRLRNVSAYSGATILGDGSVIMILDPNGLAADLVDVMDEDVMDEAASSGTDRGETQRLLLVRAGGEEPKAVPLALVTRLEEFDPNTIETANDRRVVQYRGRLMPIVALGGEFAGVSGNRQPVLVFAEDETAIGLSVDEILDVVEERVDLQMNSDNPGVIGSAIIKGKATDVVDIGWHLDQVRASGSLQRKRSQRRRVLLVDADAFARRMVAPLLAAAGYDVTPTSGLHEVRTTSEAGEHYDAVVGDPAALERMREEGLYAEAPTLAVTDWPEETQAEGLTAVLPRSDRGALIAALDKASNEEKAA